jgi:glycopeptide antibiotics resistance protein
MDYFSNFVLLGLFYYFYYYKRRKKASQQEFVKKTLMYAYIVMVLYVTIMPFSFLPGGTNRIILGEGNLIPFNDLKMNYGGAVRGILLNIIMMMPFGFLYPMIKRRGIILTVVMSFLFSLAIESFQLLNAWWGSSASRIFDVTDLITNTFGGFVGYLVYIIFRPVYRVFGNEKWTQ